MPNKPLSSSGYIKAVSMPYDYHKYVKDVYASLAAHQAHPVVLTFKNVYKLRQSDVVVLFKFIRPQQEWLCPRDRIQVGVKKRVIKVKFTPIRKEENGYEHVR